MRLYYQSAFTLIELIAVLVIVGILSATILIRITPGDANIQTAKNDVLAGLIFARETAMARSDGSSVVKFIATETSIDIQVNDTSIRNINQPYPLTLSDDVTVTSIDPISGEQQLQFTHLGETIEQDIILEDEDLSLTISVSGVGYAY